MQEEASPAKSSEGAEGAEEEQDLDELDPVALQKKVGSGLGWHNSKLLLSDVPNMRYDGRAQGGAWPPGAAEKGGWPQLAGWRAVDRGGRGAKLCRSSWAGPDLQSVHANSGTDPNRLAVPGVLSLPPLLTQPSPLLPSTLPGPAAQGHEAQGAGHHAQGRLVRQGWRRARRARRRARARRRGGTRQRGRARRRARAWQEVMGGGPCCHCTWLPLCDLSGCTAM